MNYSEAINKRKSRRTYTETPIEKIKFETLSRLAEKYNSEAGLRITIIEDGSEAFNSVSKSYGLFNGVRTVIALIGKQEDEHRKEKLGFYGELLVLEATKLELGTCWVGGTFDRKSNFVSLGKDEILECVITVGNVAEVTFKEKLIHTLAARKSKPVEEFYTSNTPIPAWIMDGLKAVQKAPSAVNRQPVTFTYHSNQLKASVKNVQRFELVDLGIAKAHFHIATKCKFEWGNGGNLFS
jgi:nitroreductase